VVSPSGRVGPTVRRAPTYISCDRILGKMGPPTRSVVTGASAVAVGLLLLAVATSFLPMSSVTAGPAAIMPSDYRSTTPSGTNLSSPVVGVIGTIPAGRFPEHMVEDVASGLLYVSNEGAGTVSVLDGTSLVTNIAVGAGASGLAYDPNNNTVYVANSAVGSVSVISGTTVIATIPTGQGPCSPVFDAQDGYVYVPNSLSNNVTILNGTTLVGSTPVGEEPVDATYDPVNGTVYITNEESDFENILEGNLTVDVALTHLIAPFETVFDSVNDLLYVTNITPNDGIMSDVTVLNGTQRVATFPVGPGPDFAGVDTSTGEVYLPSIGLDAVEVINGTSITGSVAVGGEPQQAEFDPANGLVYVPDELTDDVNVISGYRVVADVPVGQNPIAAAYSPASGYVYVSEIGAGAVDVLGTVTGWQVNFTAHGIPRGDDWSITIKQVTVSSVALSLQEYEANGSYAYLVGAPAGYVGAPANGSFTVNGGPVVLIVNFTVLQGPAGPGWLGFPNPVGALLVGGTVATLIGVTIWQLLIRRLRKRERVLRG